MFSCECCKTFKKNYIEEYQRTAAMVIFLFSRTPKRGCFTLYYFLVLFVLICYVFRFMVLHVLRDFDAAKICPRSGKCPLSGMHTPSLKSVTHILQLWNLEQLYFTKKWYKTYMNHLRYPLSSAGISIFSPQISKFCYIKK